MSGLSLKVGGRGFSSATGKVVIRSFCPKVSSPDISVDSPEAYLSFFKPERKGTKHGDTFTAHVESKGN